MKIDKRRPAGTDTGVQDVSKVELQILEVICLY
jgi:hypothetical protein